MWIDLSAKSRRTPGRVSRRRRWAAWTAIGLVAATAAGPLSLVVHEHRAGDHAHIHLVASVVSEDERDHHHSHHEGAVRRHHHLRGRAAARGSRGATAAIESAYPRRLAAAGLTVNTAGPPTLRRPCGAMHQLHWHGEQPVAFGVPHLASLFAALPLRESPVAAAPQPFLSTRADFLRARGPPRFSSIPTTTVS